MNPFDLHDFKPITEGPLWKGSGDFVTIHPICTDITHDSPNPIVLGCGLAHMKDGAVMTVYSTPTGYYSKPGTTWIAGRVTQDGGKTWSPESAPQMILKGYIGASDKRDEDVVERPCNASDFLATIHHHLGIDYSKVTINDLNGRPVHIVENGRAIAELIA